MFKKKIVLVYSDIALESDTGLSFWGGADSGGFHKTSSDRSFLHNTCGTHRYYNSYYTTTIVYGTKTKNMILS